MFLCWFCLYNLSIDENGVLKSLSIIMLGLMGLIYGFMHAIICSSKLSGPKLGVHIFRISVSSL